MKGSFDLFSGAERGMVVHSFSDGPRGIAALGSDVAIATGDSQLALIDFAQGTQAVLLGELQKPWGVARDPLKENGCYVAECDASRVVAIDLDELVPHVLAAQVAPEDVLDLGADPLPNPRNLALEDGNARLLVLCEFGGKASLRSLDLRSPVDFDQPPDGHADPFVREVTEFDAADSGAGLSTGADHLRIVILPAEDRLALGGGVIQTRRIVAAPPGSGTVPYDPETQVVTLETGLDPTPATGTPWRIQVPVVAAGAPSGRPFVYLWDSSDVPDARLVQVRVLPRDEDPGIATGDDVFKPYRSSFELQDVDLSTGTQPESVVAADLDGDGDLDLVSADYAVSTLTVTFQTAHEVYARQDTIPLLDGTGPRCIVAADLDGEGWVDLVSANSFSDNLRLFFQTAPGVFTPAADSLSAGLGSRSVAAADLDGDGDIDLAAANSGRADPEGEPEGDFTLFFQSEDGIFPEEDREWLSTGDGGKPWFIIAADLDGDGAVDLVSANGSEHGAGESLTVFFRADSGKFLDDERISLPTGAGSSPYSVAAADLDGDGDLDLVSANLGGGDLTIFFQTGAREFTEEDPISLDTGEGSEPYSVAAEDLDGDGDVDLVSANSGSETLSLFFQTGPGVFTPGARPLPVGSDPRSVAAVDLDGDGDIDLVSANHDTSDLTLLFNGE